MHVWLKFAHLLGLVLMGAGLIGVWIADMRSRQVRDLHAFAEAVRNIAVFYDGVVEAGAVLLLVSGTWLIVVYYGGWAFLGIPWLAGMVALLTFEFVEGNTVTRAYFMRLRRLTREALRVGRFTPDLERARAESAATFTHFLDLPILFVIVALGALRPDTWRVFALCTVLAVAVAAALTLWVPRLYRWGAGDPRAAARRDR